MFPFSLRRSVAKEILDGDDCPPTEIAESLRDMGRINRWFGGVTTTRSMIERVVAVTGRRTLSVLDVASGFGEVPRIAGEQLSRQGIHVEVTYLDRSHAHLLPGNRGMVADAMALPFSNASFDLISCSLFAHHLEPDELKRFTEEALRVSRYAALLNDLVRHPAHLALVYAGFPLMRSYASRADSVVSVRRAYMPHEIHRMLGGPLRKIEISRHYLFRMGVIIYARGDFPSTPAPYGEVEQAAP